MKGKLLILLLLCAAPELIAQTVIQQFAAISKGSGMKSDMDIEPTSKGSTIIAMPFELSPNVKVESVTDNAPDGPNTYKQVPGAISSCSEGHIDIWYCEKCNPGVTELQFHLSGHVKASINSFLEVSDLAASSTLDGTGAQISNGKATGTGQLAGPSIKTTATDFIVARFFSGTPYPTGVTPEAWTFKPSYAYVPKASPGTYQPTLTGGGAGGGYCMSMAAFKIAPTP